MTSLGLTAALVTAVGCAPPPDGASTFRIDGTARFTGFVTAPVSMAVFYTGTLMFTGDTEVTSSDAGRPLVSNVVDLGPLVDADVPFTLDVDLSAYTTEADTATLLMWEDDNGNGLPDAGELRSRVLADLATGCPVFGEATIVPIHWSYAENGWLGGRGWNQSDAAWYMPAGDGTAATIESEYNFLP